MRISRISPLRIFQAVSLAVSVAILLSMCRDVFLWLAYAVFLEPREDMAHGWFIPVFTLALFWLKRRELKAAAGTPSFAGLLLTLPGIFFFLVGSLGDQLRISHVAAIWLLWALLYAVYGRAFARLAAFPVAFLLFTMPMAFLDFFTVRLRIVIASLSTFLLDGLGIPMTRIGTGLYCPIGQGFNLDVADPCSGMRSIFALAALTAGYAYLTQKTLRGKWLLFACSIPLAMLGNLARIFSIALVAVAFGSKTALGFYHDYSGYVVFLVAVMAMVAVGEAIARLFSGKTAGGKIENGKCASESGCLQHGESQISNLKSQISFFVVPLVLLPLIFAATAFHIRHAPPRVQESDSFVAQALGPLDGYTVRYPVFCQSENCLDSIELEDLADMPEKCPKCGAKIDTRSLGENDLLPADTRILKANYYDLLGNAWRVSIVVNGHSRMSIHRPEICLPAQGWSIENGTIETFRLNDGENLAMHCMDVRSRSSVSASRLGHGYFFVNPRQKAASHLRRILVSVRDRAFAGRIVRWAMVTLSSEEPFASSPARKEQTEEFLSALMPMAFPRGTGESGNPGTPAIERNADKP